MNLVSMWKKAYLNCIPVHRRMDGLGIDGPATIRRIRELDPMLQVTWDTTRGTVVIWRIVDGVPFLVRDNPFGREVDHRLVNYLIATDTQRFGGIDNYNEYREKTIQALKEEDMRRRWNAIDHDKLANAHDKIAGKIKIHMPGEKSC